MTNVFADDDADAVRPHKDDKGGNMNPARHHPDASMRSAFKTANINTGMEENQRQAVKPAARSRRK
jgi:hypothetical protein